MASEVAICNRALQKLGAERITTLTEDSRNARSCNAAYDTLRDAELRAHPWSFAIKRVNLAPLTSTPVSGFDYDYENEFQLPSDLLRLLIPPTATDWLIEGRKLLTNDSTSVSIRYIYRVTDPNEFDILFQEALASRMAYELCEEITQSNTKKAAALDDRTIAIREARRTQAIVKISEEMPEDEWITARF